VNQTDDQNTGRKKRMVSHDENNYAHLISLQPLGDISIRKIYLRLLPHHPVRGFVDHPAAFFFFLVFGWENFEFLFNLSF
jgi:hypothetical protein